MSLLPRKTATNGHISDSWGKVKKNIPWDVANNRCVEHFYQKQALKKEGKKRRQKILIGVKSEGALITTNE